MTMTFPPMPRLPISSPETFEKCKSLPLRPSDIFICSYPKSGTTWTQHIVLSLVLASTRAQQTNSNSNGIDYDHVSEFAPFFDIDAHWDRNSASLEENIIANHDRLGRRVFNTHLRWEMLPKRSERDSQNNECHNDDDDATLVKKTSKHPLRPACGKFIYVTRNLLDVCASFYHHLSNQKEGTYTKGYDAFARDWMAGNIPFGSPLHHLLSFAEGFGDNDYNSDDDISVQQQQQPMLLLNFEEMKANLQNEVLRIIDFLDLTIPTEVLDNELLPSFHFQNMKNNIDKFQPKSVTWLNGYNFLRRGESGGGRSLMTTENQAQEEGQISLLEEFHKRVEKEDCVHGIQTFLDSPQGDIRRMQKVFLSLVT
eukprot:CAMPEP_0183722316 /NCGR_PEP_ID=MMETSP0737-20130205/14310_1 /TAXON_ID=385413 /ORGANISM="Thalassiosira miniscula, Strain CCMP1093" /LENGTH=367 /DNA_ID=CAMNT_0025952457 /DNA_START=25 /DNA_END=1124 /DNA_ORIENTATION=-